VFGFPAFRVVSIGLDFARLPERVSGSSQGTSPYRALRRGLPPPLIALLCLLALAGLLRLNLT